MLLALSACGGGEAAGTSTPAPTDTPVIPPTLTPTTATPLAILVLPADLDPETSNLYQKTVYDLTQTSGYRFQVRNTLSAADMAEPGLNVVISLPPDPGIAALAAAAPQVQFLAINMPEVAAGGNISVLGNTSQTDVAAFLAGYTAALITDDYRIGMLMPKDNPDALRALNAYATGMKFYCGDCKPFYFYAWTYPQYVEIPAEEDKSHYNAFADILILQYKVGTIYLHPGVATTDVQNYIGTTGVYMIGTATPEQRPAGWVMTIQPDIIKAIQNAWPGLVSGQGGLTVQSPLGLSDIDESILSPGKQRLVEQTLNDLQSGLISTGVTP
jgi:basic membrane lipoprotein Med (substrate-binding protein (PBP1-ABC) superfamily)